MKTLKKISINHAMRSKTEGGQLKKQITGSLFKKPDYFSIIHGGKWKIRNINKHFQGFFSGELA